MIFTQPKIGLKKSVSTLEWLGERSRWREWVLLPAVKQTAAVQLNSYSLGPFSLSLYSLSPYSPSTYSPSRKKLSMLSCQLGERSRRRDWCQQSSSSTAGLWACAAAPPSPQSIIANPSLASLLVVDIGWHWCVGNYFKNSRNLLRDDSASVSIFAGKTMTKFCRSLVASCDDHSCAETATRGCVRDLHPDRGL